MSNPTPPPHNTTASLMAMVLEEMAFLMTYTITKGSRKHNKRIKTVVEVDSVFLKNLWM
jgi:predicted SprT family Zn-dependent metalloprotease